MSRQIIVIGGGASGMMAAITAAREGAKVTILEQNNKLGKKILSTGNGRCNMTNLEQKKEKYRSDKIDVAWQILNDFSVADTLAFFEELGIYPKDRNGYLYPRSNQAISVTEALESEVRRLKIKCKTQEEVIRIQKDSDQYIVYTKTWHYACDSVILACGSKASVIDGSTGSGYLLAKQLGHTIIDPVPALVGLKGHGNWFSKWSGVRCEAKVRLYIDQCFCIEDIGEVQLTDYGISGIPVFQISRYAARALLQNQPVTAELDFLPEMNEDELHSFFIKIKEHDNNKSLKQLLIGILPIKLAELLTDRCADVSDMIKKIKHFSVSIKDTLDFSHAQVCSGGVSLQEVDSYTLESKLSSGAYFCGEMLDVDGACGGYNLQWAWSSGYIAGKSASKGIV